jgi:hypothetical protein
MKKLNTQPSTLNNQHKKLTEKLVSLHQTKSKYSQVPTYEYSQQKKGIMCKKCSSFSMSIRGKKIVCGDCGCEEYIEPAVLRNVKELKLLFPELKITTNVVYDWCNSIGSKKMIGRILSQNFRAIGYGKWVYYE